MSTYTEHPSGIDTDSGDVGGDYQVTKSASRSFQRKLSDGTWQILTVYAYGTQCEADEGASVDNDVQVMTESLICTDPDNTGSTEVTSDYTYAYPYADGPTSPEQAYEWACNYIRGINVEHL